MKEEALNKKSIYEEVEQIRNMNKVEGFDPKKYMRQIQKEGEETQYYLDVVFRKLWFRLKNPEGKIVKKILKLTDQVAIVEAKVYLNRDDEEDNYLANAFAQKYASADDQFGKKYVELAETAAVGRALSDAGFGLQFADKAEELDPHITEAPIQEKMLILSDSLHDRTYTEEVTEDQKTEQYQEVNLQDQYGIDAYLPVEEKITVEGSTKKSGLTKAEENNEDIFEEAKQTEKKLMEKIEISKDMPEDQIYALLDIENASKVVISTKFHKGKTLGQLAMEDPKALKWYSVSYEGPDNLLRAAAKYLMNMALHQ